VLKLKSILPLVCLTSLLSSSVSAAVGAGHVSGKITNITSIQAGLLIRIEANETPENCTSSNVWMQVDEQYKTIISLAITSWTLGKTVTVYTSPGTSGFCKITQVDPVG
jgi:hypothetical protein